MNFFELLPDRACNLRRAMPGVEATNPSSKIEKLVAIHILNHCAIRTGGENRSGVVRSARDGSFAALHQRFGIGPGDFGSKLNAFHCYLSLRGLANFA